MTHPSEVTISDADADAAVRYIQQRSLDRHTMQKLLRQVIAATPC